MINDYSTRKTKPDYYLAFTVFCLVVFGLIMIYSSSVIISHERVGHGYYFLSHQAIALAIGFLAWFLLQKLDYRQLKQISFWLLVASVVLLLLVFIPGLGSSEIKRWLYIGNFGFQPSELVKLLFIIYLASWLADRKDEVTELKKGFLPFIVLTCFVAGLVVIEPDLGTAMIFILVALAMFFMAGAKIIHLALTVVLGSGVVYALIITAPYRLSRLAVFLNPEASPMGIGYQLRNALIAIGSGGLWGLGFGNSSQKYLYLPEAHTDSIFAVASEELGFIRTIFIILAFLIIAWRGFLVAQNAPDRFGRLLAGGITVWLIIQAFINIGAMLGLVPLTGLTLPFISYGGTSLVVSMAAIGILINISKHSANPMAERAKK